MNNPDVFEITMDRLTDITDVHDIRIMIDNELDVAGRMSHGTIKGKGGGHVIRINADVYEKG